MKIVDFMRGYHHEWWVREGGGNGSVHTFAREDHARRFAALCNDGIRWEIAQQAVSNGLEVIRTGDLVFIDAFRAPLVPGKVVELKRVPVPNAPNSAYTQIEVTVKVTAARPGYTRGELVIRTGHPEIDSVLPRSTVRTVGGQIRVRSGVFNA